MGEICEHEEVVPEAGRIICIDCGEEINTVSQKDWCHRSNEHHQARPQHVITIAKDVKNMQIEKNIVDIADTYFSVLSREHGPFKNVSRKGIIFACVYFAYNKYGNSQKLTQLRKTFGITKKIAMKGLQFVQLNIPPHIPLVKCITTPEDLVKTTMSKFDASPDQVVQVQEMVRQLDQKKTQNLIRSRTPSIVKSLVYYYIMLHAIDISLKKYSKKVGLTPKTIMDNVKEISKILAPQEQ